MNYRGHPDRLSILPHSAGLTTLLSRLSSWLLPGSCLLCANDSGTRLLCTACQGELPALPLARCPVCAEQTTHGERCGACLKEPPHFDRTITCFPYAFPVDRIIQSLKYGHQLAVAGWGAQQLAPHLDARDFDLIVPMPLHTDRLRQRGFNQAAEIAAKFPFRPKIPVSRNQLLRIRPTPPQADLHPKERRKNVRGAFECRADLHGQRILLIDDVLTTGASANECARVLKLHGACSVTVAVLARAYKNY